MAVLYPHLPFQDDETPMSWAARSAAFHTGGRVLAFLNTMSIPAADLASGKPEAIERLCLITGQDPEPVLENTIMAIGERRYSLRGCEFSAEFTTGVVTRYCPLCLAEDRNGQAWPNAAMRHRLHWRLSPVRTCRKHNTPLSNVRTGKWTDMLHEVQAVEDAITASCASAQDHSVRVPSPLQEYVEGRLEGETGPAWLDGQDIDQACRAAQMLGGLMTYGSAQKAAEMTEDMWDEAGRAAWPVVRDGEATIRGLTSSLLLNAIKMNGHPSPRNAFGMVYSWLFASRLSKDPGPIRDIVRDVIIDNVPLVPGQMLLGKRIETPRLASIGSIAKAEHLHSKTLTKILELAGIIDETEPLKGAPNVVADYAKAKPLIERAKHTTPVTRVPDMLSASRPLVAALIELGQLRRIQDHDELKSKVAKAIDGRSIDEVQKFIQTQFEVVENVPFGYVHLAKAAEKTKVTLLAILELLFGLHLGRVYRLKGHHGFDAVLVSPDVIMKCIEDPPEDASDAVRFWMG